MKTLFATLLVAVLLALTSVFTVTTTSGESPPAVTKQTLSKLVAQTASHQTTMVAAEVARAEPQATANVATTKERSRAVTPAVYIVDMEQVQPRLDYLIRLGKTPLTATSQPYGFTGVDHARAREKI